MKVSVILPTFNESGCIVALVKRIIECLGDRVFEILVVDDNSPDGTFTIAQDAYRAESRVRCILRTEDHGLAASIKCGVQEATGDQLVVMDTDFTHDPAEIPRMLHVAEIYDIVSGSRFAPGGSMQSVRHYLASLFYNFAIRVILRTQIQDNLGGYFTMSRAKLLALEIDHVFRGYGEYYFRLLHEAQQAGYTIVEIPAVYRTRTSGQSKSKFFKLLFQYSGAAFNEVSHVRQARARSRRAGHVSKL